MGPLLEVKTKDARLGVKLIVPELVMHMHAVQHHLLIVILDVDLDILPYYKSF